MDPRYPQLAENLVGHSLRLQPGERVLVDAQDIPDAMVVALIRAIRERKAFPLLRLFHSRLSRELLRDVDEATARFETEVELARMKGVQAYIGLRGSANTFENSDVPAPMLQRWMQLSQPVLDWRVRKTKWVVLRWPTASMAQAAFTSTEAFERFYFDACTFDFARMEPGQKALQARMEAADQVEIKGPGETHLRFSIQGIPAVPCLGEFNVPDGEVFTAPVRESVEGVIAFNIPTVYHGKLFDGVRLEFSKGRIVKASCQGDAARLNAVLDADPGARYIGEFALGCHPLITQPIFDILFDEKIAGSFHFTPGQAYEVADNGNRSQVHWDMVCMQTPEHGGGTIHFDGELIRDNGLFVPEDLHALNPGYLLGENDGAPRHAATAAQATPKPAAKRVRRVKKKTVGKTTRAAKKAPSKAPAKKAARKASRRK